MIRFVAMSNQGKFFIQTLLSLSIFFYVHSYVFAGPASSNYELTQYDFGSGGTDTSTSDNFSLFGHVGGLEFGKPASSNFSANGGLVETLQANVPPAPTFINPATNYDRLKFIINNGDGPSDAQFAIAISNDDFTTTNYVQNDNTVGSVLGAEDWQTYTNWGGASGEFIRGLQQDTTYKIKVKAKWGNYTESQFGPIASATTSVPSLTFGISSETLTFDTLDSSNSYTDSSKATTLTTSTNAYNGYTIYGRETAPLTFASHTISDYSGTNGTPTIWSGTGFGYTTNDSSLTGGTPDRFTNGGPKYAGFTTSIPGDPVADHTSVVEENPVINEQFTVSYRVTGDNTTPAGAYTNTVVYVVVPVY